MRKWMLTVTMVLAAAVLLVGCQAHRPRLINPEFQATDLSAKLRSGELRQKIDNFYVILDSSGSKEETYGGHSKFSIAKDFLYRMNRTIPSTIYINGALRSFGASRNPFAKKTTLHYGPTQHSTSSFQTALDQVNWGGGLSPADLAIDRASDDMLPLKGKSAVILVGDGKYTGYDPVGAVNRMKARFGDDVCLYTVLVGNENPDSVKTMKSIAAASECGSYQTAKYLDKSLSLAAWVEAVFFESVAKKTAPPPPAPGDADGDGVPDSMDQCANTPRGAPVNSAGCWIIPNVLFNFNEAAIRMDYQPMLNRVAEVMKMNPDLRFTIGGHTCNIGAERYNLNLSENRANAVRQYLMGQGVSGKRLFTNGYGYRIPTATNDTEAGRKLNRRATLRWSR